MTVCDDPNGPAHIVSSSGAPSMFSKRIGAARACNFATLALFLLAACAGCGAKGAGTLPNLIPVKGKVTFKGQPLTKGTVHFEPDDYGGPAAGQLQADGSFVLTTAKEGDGVV